VRKPAHRTDRKGGGIALILVIAAAAPIAAALTIEGVVVVMSNVHCMTA
jgi:hypothetical protein